MLTISKMLTLLYTLLVWEWAIPSIPLINSETNSSPRIVNVVCKYLRQCPGTSFSVATLPICCNIEYGEGP